MIKLHCQETRNHRSFTWSYKVIGRKGHSPRSAFAPLKTFKKRTSHKWLQTVLKTVLVSIITQMVLTSFSLYLPIPEDERPIRHTIFSYRHQRIRFFLKKNEQRSLILELQLSLSNKISYNEGDFANIMWHIFTLTNVVPLLCQAKQKVSDYIFFKNPLPIPSIITKFKTWKCSG